MQMEDIQNIYGDAVCWMKFYYQWDPLREEAVPRDWRKQLLTYFHKKGSHNIGDNDRGIVLLSSPNKGSTKAIIN